MSDAPELLPCPFCGGANVRIDVGLMEFTDGEVTCEDCGGNCGNHPTKAEAITAWNRRADISEAAIAAARAEGERIGMERALEIMNGDYRTVAKVFRDDGLPSKHDICGHGLAMWEECFQCAEDAIAAAWDAKP